jgi:hypothetical protein
MANFGFWSFLSSRTAKTTPADADLIPLGDAGATITKQITFANLKAEILGQGLGKRVRAATTANITISTALNNGDTLDGVTLVTGDLILVKDQSTTNQNGIYVVGVSPARAVDFDTYDEHPGKIISVEEGTANADTLWKCTSNVGGTLNTTAIVFAAVTSSGSLLATNNLSDLASAATSRTNLGVNSATRTITAKTANYTVVIGDDQTIFTNTGAGGIVTFTLPANASCTAGKTRFKFVNLAAQQIQVQPASGHIYFVHDGVNFDGQNGSPVQDSAQVGESIEVVYLGSNVWIAEMVQGNWS